MAAITSAKGTTFFVPESFLENYQLLARENKDLRDKSQTCAAAASSTEIEDDRLPQRHDRVRLQDTYTCHQAPAATHDGSSTPQVLQVNKTQPLLGNRDRAWGGGGSLLKTKHV